MPCLRNDPNGLQYETVEPKTATVTNSPQVPAEAAVRLSDDLAGQAPTLDAQSIVSSPIDNQAPAVTSIAVIGLGYVGLPLSIQFARSRVAVLGLDIDLSKVVAVNRAQSYIKH